MMKAGDDAWFIDVDRKRKVKIMRMTRSDAIIKFQEGGGIRVSLNRLYSDEAVADQKLREKLKERGVRRKNQYDYMMEMDNGR